MSARGAELDHGRILLAGTVFVYLERTRTSEGPPAGGAPGRPYGLAPTALTSEGDVLGALYSEEAVWLGFEAVDRDRPVSLQVRAERDPALDALVPPDYCLPGPFGHGELTVRTEAPVPGRVSIRLVDPDAFAAVTGVAPEPLDPEQGYGGWLLP